MVTRMFMLIGPALIAGSAATWAQQPPAPPAPPAVQDATTAPLYDPDQLPAYKGTVQLFTLTPRGDIDGLILADGTEVKTPPHLSTELAFSIKLGDAVTVHGLKAAAMPLIQAMSVTDDATRKTVVDNGPEGTGRGPGPLPPVLVRPNGGAMEPAQAQTQGRIRMTLHGPRGDINGALLDDGTILRLPPPEAARFSYLLQPGQTVVVAGPARANAIGRLVDVTAIGTSPEELMPVEPDKGGKHGRKGPPPA